MSAPRDNFHQSELDKFGALANRWWDADGPQKPLHALNPVRLDYVRHRAQLDGATVLDVGCGGGLLSEAMARLGAKVTAIDLAEDLVKVASKYTEDAKVAVRNVRRDANDSLKKLEKDKAISEDEQKKASDDVQKLTDRFVADADKKCAAKEKEIMEI